jgi:hypothetical protein
MGRRLSVGLGRESAVVAKFAATADLFLRGSDLNAKFTETTTEESKKLKRISTKN